VALVHHNPDLRDALGLGSFAPGNIREFPQIQGADIFAYFLRQGIEGTTTKSDRYAAMLDTMSFKYYALQSHESFARLEHLLNLGVFRVKRLKYQRDREKRKKKIDDSEGGD
jgi:hypothetical protein